MRISLITGLIAALIVPAVPAVATGAPAVQDRPGPGPGGPGPNRPPGTNRPPGPGMGPGPVMPPRPNPGGPGPVVRPRPNQGGPGPALRPPAPPPLATPRRDWRQNRRYDHNRFEPGYQRYYADRYYRDGRYYKPRRLTRNDRIYRGSNGRYYCRRSDGTTGLILGSLLGGTLGNSLSYGDSQVLGALIGGSAGAILGQAIDRGNLVCR